MSGFWDGLLLLFAVIVSAAALSAAVEYEAASRNASNYYQGPDRNYVPDVHEQDVLRGCA
jgi:hypothetical protein